MTPIHENATSRSSERGNILFIVLLAIVLIGLLTAVITNSSTDNASISDEQMAIKVSEVQRYASELERAVNYIMQNSGVSEEDIRFMNPDGSDTTYGDISADTNMQRQVFNVAGGGAGYRDPPSDIQTTVTPWQFTGYTRIPSVGIDAEPDLIAYLPNVTQQFCEAVNKINGQTKETPQDDSLCITSSTRFGTNTSASQFSAYNDFDETTFTYVPAMQACVECADGTYHFYHVLMAR